MVAFLLARRAGLMSIVAAVSSSITPVMQLLPTEFPDFGLTPEQRHEAVFGHYYEYPGMDGERGEIWCYTPRFAYRDGETVTLHVSSTAATFRLDVVRDGAAETPVLTIDNQTARWQETPDQCSVEGCGWEPRWNSPSPPNGRPAPTASP